ncbi:MAG: hypothetical protein IID42_11035 [Planctomycetes bacterium]|nr:hypothetical protein [Planctomycetota bacterium]
MTNSGLTAWMNASELPLQSGASHLGASNGLDEQTIGRYVSFVTTALPASSEEWLREIACAFVDAKEAQPLGKLMGEPIAESNLFHLAPQVFFKFRDLRPSKQKRTEIVEGTLASYVVTMDEGTGRGELHESPILSFAFCYLAAHFVAGLLDEASVERVMDLCVAGKSDLERLVAEDGST